MQKSEYEEAEGKRDERDSPNCAYTKKSSYSAGDGECIQYMHTLLIAFLQRSTQSCELEGTMEDEGVVVYRRVHKLHNSIH